MRGIFKKLSLVAWLTVVASVSVFAWALVAQPALAQEARDCDNNAVIRCGALSVGELQQKYNQNANNTQLIFRQFGITSASNFSGMVSGSVNTNNQVLVGNKVVATNALTAGRQNISGSTPVAGPAYMRPPSVSFAQKPGSLHALVKIVNGQFKFAVITSCGNPVKAQPVPPPKPAPKPTPKVPGFSINKEVKLPSQTTWQKDVTALNNQTVNFRVIIKNTGQTTLTNVAFRDLIPEGLTPITGTFKLNSQTVSGRFASEQTIQATIGSIAVGQQAVLLFNTSVNNDANACGTARLVNKAFAKPPNLPEKSSQATVKVCKPAPPPVTPPPAQPVVQSVVTELPKTGAGEPLAIFAAISVGAAFWHKFIFPLVRQ